jgi:hypothetical protein
MDCSPQRGWGHVRTPAVVANPPRVVHQLNFAHSNTRIHGIRSTAKTASRQSNGPRGTFPEPSHQTELKNHQERRRPGAHERRWPQEGCIGLQAARIATRLDTPRVGVSSRSFVLLAALTAHSPELQWRVCPCRWRHAKRPVRWRKRAAQGQRGPTNSKAFDRGQGQSVYGPEVPHGDRTRLFIRDEEPREGLGKGGA